MSVPADYEPREMYEDLIRLRAERDRLRALLEDVRAETARLNAELLALRAANP